MNNSEWVNGIEYDMTTGKRVNNTKRSLADAFEEVASPKPKRMDAYRLGMVASMMDEWTRTENTAMAQELENKEAVIFNMAGEIARLQQLNQLAANTIRGQRADLRANESFIARMQTAAMGMANTIALYNNEVNQLVPGRRYGHQMASDEWGISHVVVYERGQEVIDLTTSEEYDSESTEEDELIDMAMQALDDA